MICIGARSFALSFVLWLGGCASAGPYRTGQHDNDKVIVSGPGYSLGFVELDEQGWVWGQKGQQMLQVQHLIAKNAHLLDNAPHTASGIILVAFVHGWKNNAAPDNDNVGHFEEILATIARNEGAAHPDKPRPVVGVYIGWPGLSATVEPFLEMSFYSRKNTADRVGYLGGVTEILCRLEKLHETINASLAADSSRSFFVVAGHSFGAQVVYDALSSVMTQRVVAARVAVDVKLHRSEFVDADNQASFTVRQRPVDDQPVKPFGDLVLLINPAFEAERYHNLRKLSEQFEYPSAQRPVFAVFSSDTDSATHFWFPIGRYLSTLFERYRDDALHDEQRDGDHHTIPWTESFVTHHLETEADAHADAAKQGAGPARLLLSAAGVDTDSPGYLRQASVDWNTQTRSAVLELSHCVLTPVDPNPDRWTPFYVVRVRPSLINGHSDIWEKPFEAFIAKFIAISVPAKS